MRKVSCDETGRCAKEVNTKTSQLKVNGVYVRLETRYQSKPNKKIEDFTADY